MMTGGMDLFVVHVACPLEIDQFHQGVHQKTTVVGMGQESYFLRIAVTIQKREIVEGASDLVGNFPLCFAGLALTFVGLMNRFVRVEYDLEILE